MAKRDLKGKRILITGASSGIGKAIAIEAGERGARVFVTGRNQERLAAVVKTIRQNGGIADSLDGDLTDPIERERLLRAVEQSFGGLDVLVNNAGHGATGHFQYATPDRLRSIMELNFFAPCELSRLAIPMLKMGADPAILMINSVAGRRAIPSRTEYSASKFALMGFSEALRGELSKDNIEVCVVSPGLTESSFEDNMLENSARHSLHAQRSMKASDAATLILNSLEKRKNETTLTFKGKMLVTLSRFFPRFIDYKMSKFVKSLYREESQKSAATAQT